MGALEWLSHYPNCQDPSNCENIKQRYVLALLYYSMNGENWSYEDSYYSVNGTNWSYEYPYTHIINGENWLSQSFECGWWGVECDNNNQMAVLDLIENNLHGSL